MRIAYTLFLLSVILCQDVVNIVLTHGEETQVCEKAENSSSEKEVKDTIEETEKVHQSYGFYSTNVDNTLGDVNILAANYMLLQDPHLEIFSPPPE